MKIKIIITLLLALSSSHSFAQTNDLERLKQEVKQEFQKWLKKGDFETTSDYEKRIKNQIAIEFIKIKTEKMNAHRERAQNIYFIAIGNYDTENQTFPFVWKYLSGKMDTAIIHIPINVAPHFAETYKQSRDNPRIYLKAIDVAMINNNWKVINGVLFFDNNRHDIGQRVDLKKMWKEEGVYMYEFDSYGIKKYPTKDIKVIQENSTVQGSNVYFFEWETPIKLNSTTQDFDYYDLGISIPEFN